MTDQLQFPLFIDSSILSDIKECKKRAYWKHIRGKASRGASIHLVAGGAFARGLEVTRRAFFADGMGAEDALGEGLIALLIAYDTTKLDADYEEHAKSPARIAGALVAYFDRYPIATDILKPAIINSKPAIEFSFSLELPNCHHPETNEPILYCGRSDMISEYNESLIIVDEKTTMQLGPTWGQKWDLRSQFMGYTWAGKQHGLPVIGAMARGVAIRKTGYDFAQALVQFSDWQIDRWLEQTCRDVNAFIECFKNKYYDYNFGEACTAYGGCEMKRLCTVKDPEPWVDLYYEDHYWNPLRQASTSTLVK